MQVKVSLASSFIVPKPRFRQPLAHGFGFDPVRLFASCCDAGLPTSKICLSGRAAEHLRKAVLGGGQAAREMGIWLEGPRILVCWFETVMVGDVSSGRAFPRQVVMVNQLLK